MIYMYAKIFSKFHLESVQKLKTVFEIAYHSALNFQNKFKNILKANYRQNFLENADFCKMGHIFFPKFFHGQFHHIN